MISDKTASFLYIRNNLGETTGSIYNELFFIIIIIIIIISFLCTCVHVYTCFVITSNKRNTFE